jgi:TonB family protein
LRYGSSGALITKATSGDWTTDGFVKVDTIRGSSSGDGFVIDARRILVVSVGRLFQFHAAELTDSDRKKKPVLVQIEADLGMHSPSAERADAALSRIFLTAQDALANMVPDYWNSCVSAGLKGTNAECLFSDDIQAVPGVALSDITQTVGPTSKEWHLPLGPLFLVGNGVSPPRTISNPDPEFSESARQIKFQGVTTLGLVVNSDGRPMRIRILSPLGCGLDAKAVKAVQGWKFNPAEKDGRPVAVEIAVEVNFHLY